MNKPIKMQMTLSQLKQTAELYEWALVRNSWIESVPDYQSAWRSVASKNTVGLKLNTLKDGTLKETHLDWPKASETTITHDSCHLVLTINRIIPANKNMGREEYIHTMQYHLRPNLNLISV